LDAVTDPLSNLALVTAFVAIFDAVTALLAIFGVVTAPLMSCAVPTLLEGTAA